MKHLLSGVAVIAALAFGVPVGAQPANPSGGNAVGLPGPNPGGPGLTPYSSGQAPPTAATPPSSETTSATPPTHRHARYGSHGKVASHHPSRFPNLQGNNVANELNQAELARLQSGNPTPPPASGYEMPSGAPPGTGTYPSANPNPQLNRMPAGGRPTSGTVR